MFCWTPESNNCALIPWPDTSDLQTDRGLEFSALACYSYFQELNFEQRKAVIFYEAMHAIIRDKVPAEVVHETLLPLAEYQDALAADMPGKVRR